MYFLSELVTGEGISNMTRRKRPAIDPKTLKKHSQVMAVHKGLDPVGTVSRAFSVRDGSTKTATGYRDDRLQAKNFETFVEVLSPRTSTNTFKHQTGTKWVFCLEGSLFLSLKVEDKEYRVTLDKGQSYELGPMVEYVISSPADYSSMLVVQDSKYEKRLKVVKETEISAKSVPALVSSVSDVLVRERLQKPRGKTKAAEQLVAQRSGRTTSPPAQQGPKASEADFRSTFTAGINPQPIVFDEE